jgi:hypothetical protein
MKIINRKNNLYIVIGVKKILEGMFITKDVHKATYEIKHLSNKSKILVLEFKNENKNN